MFSAVRCRNCPESFSAGLAASWNVVAVMMASMMSFSDWLIEGPPGK